MKVEQAMRDANVLSTLCIILSFFLSLQDRCIAVITAAMFTWQAKSENVDFFLLDKFIIFQRVFTFHPRLWV